MGGGDSLGERQKQAGVGKACGCEVASKKVPLVLVVFCIADQLRLILKQEQDIKVFKSYINQMPPEGEHLDDKIFCDVYDGFAFRDIQNSADMCNSLDDNSELHLYLQSGLDYGQIARWSAGKLGLQLYNIINLPRQRRFVRNRTYVQVLQINLSSKVPKSHNRGMLTPLVKKSFVVNFYKMHVTFLAPLFQKIVILLLLYTLIGGALLERFA